MISERTAAVIIGSIAGVVIGAAIIALHLVATGCAGK